MDDQVQGQDPRDGWERIGCERPLLAPSARFPPPLVDPAPLLLNTHELSWQAVEHLVVALAQDVEGCHEAWRYGRPGEQQHGVDVVGFFSDRPATAYQAKNVAKFKAGDLERAVEEWASGNRPFEAKRFVVVVTVEANSTAVLDQLHLLRNRYRPLTIELWDRHRLSGILRNHPKLISRFFGAATARAFTGTGECDNTISGTVHGDVVQARHIDRVLFSAPIPATTAMAGLPPVSPEFTGRRDELAQLAEALRTGGERPPVLVSAIAGLAGVGKTALVVRAAHDACQTGKFPGGVLFIDLQGYSLDGPVPARDALATLTQALGVPGGAIPLEQAGREALYRSTLAELAAKNRAVLVVLDNAVDSAQVRPLLPTTDVHRVLITSRLKLADLSARRLDLKPLSQKDSVALIRAALEIRKAHDSRVGAEPESAQELAKLCGNLPLALTIVAAILAADPDQSFSELTSLMRDAPNRLDELSYGNSQAVLAAFDVSYARLTDEQARVFRLLVLDPSGQVDAGAAAALANLPEPLTRRLLNSLHNACILLPGDRRGYYRYHDLVGLYAKRRLMESETAKSREEAIDRLLEYYLAMANSAADILRKSAYQRGWQERLTTRKDAIARLDVIRSNLLAATILANEIQCFKFIISLCLTVYEYVKEREYWDYLTSISGMALAAARAVGDRYAEVTLLCNLAEATRDPDTARDYLDQAAAIGSVTGNACGEARALNQVGRIEHFMGYYEDARQLFMRSAHLCQNTDPAGYANVLRNIGVLACDLLGEDSPRGNNYIEDALDIFRELGDHESQIALLINLGENAAHTGNYRVAYGYHIQALSLYVEVDLDDYSSIHPYSGKFLVDDDSEEGVEADFESSVAAAFESLADNNTISRIRSLLNTLSSLRGRARRQLKIDKAAAEFDSQIDYYYIQTPRAWAD